MPLNDKGPVRSAGPSRNRSLLDDQHARSLALRPWVVVFFVVGAVAAKRDMGGEVIERAAIVKGAGPRRRCKADPGFREHCREKDERDFRTALANLRVWEKADLRRWLEALHPDHERIARL